LEGSVPAADVALVEPVASKLHTEGSALAETAGDIFNDLEHLFNHLEALQVPTRQFPSTAKDWESVRLVIVPSGLYLERAVTDRLQAWVEAGGTLVATCPIGRYDEHSWPDGHLLRSLWGVTGAKRQRSGGELVLSPFNSPTHPLTHSPKLPVSNVGEAVWSFEVDERKATVLARYAAGGVAALRAEVGAGRAYLLGFPANWSMSAFDAVVLRPALAETITPFVVTDNPRLRLYLRQKGKARLLFVLNQMHTAPEQVTLTFRQPARITDLRLAVALPPTDHLTLHLRPGEGRVFKVEGR
jgi:beta-galactosidase GanA